MTTLLWILAIALIGIGVVGTVLPALPGATLVFAGVLLAAWIDDFNRISGWTIGILGVFAVMTWVIDFAAAALGAKRVGASGYAIAGAALGTLVGIFTGLWGLVFMPLAGSAIGEYIAQRDMKRAGRVGIATWLGLLLGTALKVAIVFTMLGVFAAALIF